MFIGGDISTARWDDLVAPAGGDTTVVAIGGDGAGRLATGSAVAAAAAAAEPAGGDNGEFLGRSGDILGEGEE